MQVFEDGPVTIYQGDVLAGLAKMAPGSVQTCITSPPYWGLRDYKAEGQLGLEATPDEYVARMADVFDEVRRVLHDQGTLWLNIGDSYNAYNANRSGESLNKRHRQIMPALPKGSGLSTQDLKPKDLLGIPWMLAFELRRRGWFLRCDIIWNKPNPMPESVTDRPTKCHEYLFLLSKSERYFYDAEAIKEPAAADPSLMKTPDGWDTGPGAHGSFHKKGREKENIQAEIKPASQTRAASQGTLGTKWEVSPGKDSPGTAAASGLFPRSLLRKPTSPPIRATWWPHASWPAHRRRATARHAALDGFEW